jgi:hypothetical protein
MNALLKIRQSLGWRAVQVLGPVGYVRYFCVFLLNLPKILRSGNFFPLDRAMGSRPVRVHVNGCSFVIDCPFADKNIHDNTFSFGNVREMFIKGSYLRNGIEKAARDARTVLDLGANRGTFSVMMAARGAKVVSVEVVPEFRKIIDHNMALNGLTNYAVETCFIGAGGDCDSEERTHVSIPELMDRHGIDYVDLIKMDIEGSEYALFESPEWLDRVGALCMEIHTLFGNPQMVMDTFKARGFDAVILGESFKPITDFSKAEYVYAVRREKPRPAAAGAASRSAPAPDAVAADR